jgi:diazepam-binding inhibitor (GABA receptor modulating acyl-CoA-binding protein)
MNSDLDIAFREAFIAISRSKQAVAPYFMLRFYAYNKQANFGSNFPLEGELDLRNGFKINAWMQLKDMSSDEAKKEYIELANSVLINNK